MHNVRGKLVNFRVSEAEFEQLKAASSRDGARCLSAFARKMVLSATDAGAEHLGERLTDLDRRLSTLEGSLGRLFHALTTSSTNLNTSQE